MRYWIQESIITIKNMSNNQSLFLRFGFAITFSYLVYSFLSIDLLGDPSIFKRWGDFGDEGYWVSGAKNFLYYGSFSNGVDDLNQAEIGAPLYTLFLYISFILFDDSLQIARSLSVFFACLVVFSVFLSSILSLKNKFIFTLLFVTSSTVISNSQWGTPQSMQIFFEFLAMLTLCIALTDNKKSLLYFFSGAFAACVISTKLSGYIFVGCYFAVLLLIYMITRKFKSIAAACAGFFIFLTPLAIYLLINSAELMIFLSGLGKHGALLYDNFPFIEFRPLFFLVFSYDTALKIILTFGILSGLYLLLPIRGKLAKVTQSQKNLKYFLFPVLMVLLYIFLTITADTADRRVYSFILPAIMCFVMLIAYEEDSKVKPYSIKLFCLNFLAFFLISFNLYQFSIIKTNRTFSHSQLSAELNTILNKNDCVIGVISHWFVEDTKAIPVWYSKNIGLNAFNPKISFTNSKKCNRNFLITGLFEGRYLDTELSKEDFVKKGFYLEAVQDVYIAPAHPSHIPRFDGTIFEITPLDT